MWTSFLLFSVDENIVLIHNNKDIELFDKDFINISLKAC